MSDPDAIGDRKTPAAGSSAPRVVRVLCVEDLHPVAEAICDEVGRTSGLESVGALTSPDNLVREVRRLKPDVVLLDLYYGGRDAFKELAALSEAEPAVRVIVVSGDNHPTTVERAFATGARGYVVKGSMAEVIEAVNAVSRGGIWRPGGKGVAGDLEHDPGDIIDAMIAALGDPASNEGRRWVWQLGRLRVEARPETDVVIIDLPWPLRSIPEPPTFADLHEEAGGEVKLRFAIGARAELDLVLGVIAHECRA